MRNSHIHPNRRSSCFDIIVEPAMKRVQRQCAAKDCRNTASKTCLQKLCGCCCRKVNFEHCKSEYHRPAVEGPQRRGTNRKSEQKCRRQQLEKELFEFVDGLARQAVGSREEDLPSFVDDIFAEASKAKIAKTLLDCLLCQRFDPLVELLGPSSARSLQGILPEECTDAERLRACREETAVGTENCNSASAAVETEEVSVCVAPTEMTDVPLAGNIFPELLKSLVHVPKEQHTHVLTMRLQIWKALHGGSAFDRDSNAHRLRQELQEAPNVTETMMDNLIKKKCPLPFESERQWDEFRALVA